MRIAVKEYKIYDIQELKEVNKTAYDQALENASISLSDEIMTFDFYDFKNSLKTFLDFFDIDITDFSVGLFNRSYMHTNVYDYRNNNDNSEINRHVKTLNKMINDSDPFALTGVWSDDIIMKYFKDNKIQSVSYNDIHKHLKEVVSWSLSEFIRISEEVIMSEKYLIDYAISQGWEFLETGDIYY